MESNQPTHASFTLTSTALLSLVGHLSDFPNPDDSNPPGPWGPVIRRAAERARYLLGPSPEPWNEVLLNPQPLPPKAAFAQALAQEAIDRAALMQEVADALTQAGERQGIIIIGGMVSRFIDDCGNGKIKHPVPPPRHSDGRLGALELLVMAAEFERSATATNHEGLRREFGNASARLVEIAAGRLQSATVRSAG
ncbi:MAG TPA: hypothetical protein VNN73_12015 [Blastocatellia bacterium]|nr:hypothetical protein [Blastocatellia bacterium]